MKNVVWLSTHFLLSDDFQGGLSDALRQMADYHDVVKGHSSQRLGEPLLISEEHMVRFKVFSSKVEEGFRMDGQVGLIRWNGDTHEWDMLDVNA